MTTEDPTDGQPAAVCSILLQLATDLEHEAVDAPAHVPCWMTRPSEMTDRPVAAAAAKARADSC